MKHLILYCDPSVESETGWKTKAKWAEVAAPESPLPTAMGLDEGSQVVAVIEFSDEPENPDDVIERIWADEEVVTIELD